MKNKKIIRLAAFAMALTSLWSLSACNRNGVSPSGGNSSEFDIGKFKSPLQIGSEIDANSVFAQIFGDDVDLGLDQVTIPSDKYIITTASVTAATKQIAVTDNAGKVVTQIITEPGGAAVTDAKGSKVTEQVTEIVTLPVTTQKGDSYQPDKDSMKQLKSFWMDLSKQRDFVFDGSLITLKFKVKNDAPMGAVAPVAITRCDMSNWGTEDAGVGPQELFPKQERGSVKVGDTPISTGAALGGFTLYVDNVAAKPGEEVTVNINLANNPGFVAFIIFFTYDSNILELISQEGGSDFNNATA